MEALISAVLGDLAGRAISFVVGKCCEQRTTEEDLQRLQQLLLRLRAIVEEAEGRCVMNRQMICQAERSNTVSNDPITGANQNTDTYWGRIKTALDERKLVGPVFANIDMDRGEKAMSNRWPTIQTACNKWHGIVEEVAARLESGANVEGQMIRMFTMYRTDNKDQEFKFLHMFSRIESCEKWREVRLALDRAKETYNPDALLPVGAEGRPDGTKKARAVRDAAPATERLQASIEQCIADVKSSAARREEKSDTRWSALMINVAAKKRNTDLEFLMGADTSTMDEKVKVWYMV
ncbi:putative methionyl-tRNA synthetase [Hordeum vulgare]|nr:putative methionyl-tRNA synthetase [Hordeum vulgare]